VDPTDTILRVTTLIHESLQIEVDRIDVDLIESGILDSLALVELIFQLEQEFGVTIRLEEMSVERFRTISSISELIDELSFDRRP
jgi:acyl carrier protein